MRRHRRPVAVEMVVLCVAAAVIGVLLAVLIVLDIENARGCL